MKIKRLRKKLRARLPLIAVVSLMAVAGTSALIFSSANTPYKPKSTSPNDVIVHFALPEEARVINNSIQNPLVAPFTLYGNGLLVCGKNYPNQFDPTKNPLLNKTENLATSKILTPQQIQQTIDKIVATGFLQLKKEYYRAPVNGQQSTVRLSLSGGEHFVLFYNDTAPPAAYTKTLKILEETCAPYKQPYTINNMGLRIKRIQATGRFNYLPGTQPLTSYSTNIQTTLKTGIEKADVAIQKYYASPNSPIPITSTTHGEVSQSITGTDAQTFVRQMNGKQRIKIQTVNEYGSNKYYEVVVDQRLPEIKNQLKIDYNAIRPQTSSNTGGGTSTPRNGTPGQVQPRGVRIVVLLAADGGDPAHASNVANRVGPSMYKWYCEQVGRCYNYQGVSVMRGSRSMAEYNACRAPQGCTDTLNNILGNVANFDRGTIYRSDVDTLLVTGWATDVLQRGHCGWGFIGDTLSAVDAYTDPDCDLGRSSSHELGHTFGLTHTANNTLMDGTPFTQFAASCGVDDPGLATCRLDSAQAEFLRRSEYFVSIYEPRPYTFIVLAQHPEQEAQYRQLANNKVNFVFRTVDANRNGPDIREWDRNGTRYFYTAASSDFVAWQGRSTPYVTLEEGNEVLSRPNSLGLYIHEMITYRASQSNYSNWGAAAHLIDWGRIDAWVMNAKARGKKVIWSEPAYGWQTMQTNAEINKLFAKWGDTLVPMFATNFESAGSGYLMGKSRKAAVDVSQRYGMPLGESVQSWYFQEQNIPITPEGVRDLMKYGAEKNVTYYQIEGRVEGAIDDMRWGSPYMNGVHLFSQQLANGTLGVSTKPRAPLYQMWNNQTVDHYYAANEADRNFARSVGYQDQEIAGYVDTQPTPGVTVPLYELWSTTYTDHFYTTDWNQVHNAYHSWPYYQQNNPPIKVVGYVQPTRQIGTLPFMQLWYAGRPSVPGDADHFYTTDNWQRDNAMKLNYGIQYQYQGVTGYLYSSP